jgi:hypothetical protein
MMARRTFGRGVMGLLAGAVLGGCGFLNGKPTYRFRMTVEMETPEGVKSGSSVMEIYAEKHAALTSEEGSGFTSGLIRAEAVVIELPRGPVFALLTRASDARAFGGEITEALAQMAHNGDWETYMAAVKRLGGENGVKADLPRTDWPMMVRFGDLNDPKSVEPVDPAAIGVKRIMLETTSDDVTTGIEKRIPWFIGLVKNKAKLNGKTSAAIFTNDLVDNLGPGSFSTEVRP